MLSRWADVYARQVGHDAARVRRWVAYMAGGALSRETVEGVPRFALKGGVALELRLRGRGRATRDLDVVLNDPRGDLLDQLHAALHPGFEQFTFRIHGDARALRPDTVRAEVSVQYGGKSWARVQVDLSRGEAGLFEVEMVEALDFGGVSFGFPAALPCLSLHLQAAQKLHAMTRPSIDGRPNTRFRDLVDLVLLIDLIDDLPAFRSTCVDLFAHRNTHPWPPAVELPPDWEGPFTALAEQVELPVTDARQAIFRLRTFLNKVDPGILLFKRDMVPDELNATVWYYALGSDGQLHRVSASDAQSILSDRDNAEIRPEWYRDPGGVVLFEILLFLTARQPALLWRCFTYLIATEPAATDQSVAITPAEWKQLATTILRRAKRSGSRATLAAFLSIEPAAPANNLRVFTALAGIGVREALRRSTSYLYNGLIQEPMWSFAHADVIIPVPTTGVIQTQDGVSQPTPAQERL